MHAPPAQTAPAMHGFEPAHDVPSGALVPTLHLPDEGSHAPASWQASDGAQTTGSAPEHVPPWHESVCVQAFPSLHAAPLVTGVCVQAPAAQASLVHAFPSSHEEGQLAPSDPSPSWQVTCAPELRTTWAAEIAPVNPGVFSVTRAFGATRSAWTRAPEFTPTAVAWSTYTTSDFAVSPVPGAGPVNESLSNVAPPMTEIVVGAWTTRDAR